MQGCRDTGMQGCRGAGFRDAGIQGCRDEGIQGYRDAGTQGCKDAGVQGCRDDTGSHGRGSGKSNSVWECYSVDSLASPEKLSLVLELQRGRVGIYASAHWAPREDAL